MFCVIFVVQPRKECFNDYLEIAQRLKPALEATDGFIDNERYRSMRTEGLVLSLSTWRDEKAVVRWRTLAEHHAAQQKGRYEIFEDYQLRVGEVSYDSQPPKGMMVEERRFDETEVGKAKVATITEVLPGKGAARSGGKVEIPIAQFGVDARRDGILDLEMFQSIHNPGKLLLLGFWRDAAAAGTWVPTRPEAAGALRHRRVRIIRNYGMFDRREAPQFFPDLTPPDSVAAG